jgi:hypothetical protein
MKLLYATELADFSRNFRFSTCKVRRVRLIEHRRGEPTLIVLLSVRKASASLNTPGKVVLLKLEFTGVEEFRWQRRPGQVSNSKTITRFGFFQNLFYVDFDAYAMSSGDVPKLHDFRASDSFAGCRDLKWEIVERKS